MNFLAETPTPLGYFESLVRSDSDFALFEAAVCLAQDEYTDCDVQTVLNEVDQLLARLKRHLSLDATPLEKLRALNQFFYGDLGFAGNVNDYYHPDNSYIHMLLDTRRGIPISLAVLWMELASGLGLSVQGLNLPGHFMVKVNLSIGQAVIDPLTGRSLSREELSERIEPYRKSNDWAAESEVPLGFYLQPTPPREIIARMLRNLKDIYRMQEDWPRMLAVQERLVVLLPQSWPEYRDRGLTHAALGHTDRAVADLECYLVHTDALVDINEIAERVEELRRQSS